MAPFDTDWPADSVEFCPTPGLEHILVCGTYKLDDPENTSPGPSEPDDEGSYSAPRSQYRRGKCLVFQTSAGNDSVRSDLRNIQEISLPAVLDMKWCHRTPSSPAALAIADSEGYVSLYEWSEDKHCLKILQTLSCAPSDVICLSLDWSNRRYPVSGLGSLIVSLSNCNLAILRSDTAHMMAVADTWSAHDFEPWAAAWNYWDMNVLYSGGDDLKMKGWDCRQGFATPIFVNKRFDAGVTSIQSHPFVEHLVAVGSYDSTVRLFDTRKPLTPLAQADVGGGAWRVKWHPSARRRNDLLVACMHDDFKVVRFNAVGGGLDKAQDIEGEYAVVKRYDEHASLAYGVDWSFAGKDDDGETLIASCSFYDHTMNVWQG